MSEAPRQGTLRRLIFPAQGQSEADDAVGAGDLYEYAFCVNVGRSFFDIVKALQLKSPC